MTGQKDLKQNSEFRKRAELMASEKRKYTIISIVCMTIACIGVFLQFGFLSLFSGIIPLHFLLFLKASQAISELKETVVFRKTLFHYFCFSFIIFYLFSTDITEYGFTSSFFGLLDGNLASVISSIAAGVHIIIFIGIIYLEQKYKKEEKESHSDSLPSESNTSQETIDNQNSWNKIIWILYLAYYCIFFLVLGETTMMIPFVVVFFFLFYILPNIHWILIVLIPLLSIYHTGKKKKME